MITVPRLASHAWLAPPALGKSGPFPPAKAQYSQWTQSLLRCRLVLLLLLLLLYRYCFNLVHSLNYRILHGHFPQGWDIFLGHEQ